MEHQTSNICYSFISEDEFGIRRDCGLPPGICCTTLECLQTGQSRFTEATGRHPAAPRPDGTSPEKYLEQDRRHPQGDEPSHRAALAEDEDLLDQHRGYGQTVLGGTREGKADFCQLREDSQGDGPQDRRSAAEGLSDCLYL